MSDLFNIPGDDHKEYRLKKFVEYQHEVPSIHYRFLGEYVVNNAFSKDDAVDMCFYMLITYNELTCILLFNLLKVHTPYELWDEYKEKLVFGSARKYAKYNDQFCGLIKDWRNVTEGEPYKWIKRCCTGLPTQNYINIQTKLREIDNVGRFAADLFLECAVYLKDYLKIDIEEPAAIDWKNCANLTSGIYNIFYEDEKAETFDRKKTVSDKEKLYLTMRLKTIQKKIIETYPEQDSDISSFIGKICSFRNLFKNARYGGFHHDRQLGVLREYEKNFPEYKTIWRECYDLRKKMFPERFLGEVGGWDGIRKERKHIWIYTGRTGAEP